MRELFGVGARAEILHAFVAEPRAQMKAADPARLTGYTKRNVTEELERLELARLRQVAAPSNQFLYRLHNRTVLLDFVGQRPKVFSNWEPIFGIVTALLDHDPRDRADHRDNTGDRAGENPGRPSDRLARRRIEPPSRENVSEPERRRRSGSGRAT